MFQKHLIEDRNLHYGEFMNDLSRLVVSTISHACNRYMHRNIFLQKCLYAIMTILNNFLEWMKI